MSLAIGEHHGPFRRDPAGRNRAIAGQEAREHSRLLRPGHEPQHAPGAVEPLQSALKYFRPEFEAAIARGQTKAA